jgi:hypothetical protein
MIEYAANTFRVNAWRVVSNRQNYTDSSVVDLDLHGYVGIRLQDARPMDVRRVERQLGLSATQLEREPDITIKFVDEIRPTGTLTYVGLHETGFDGVAFHVLRGGLNVAGKATIPLEHVGGACLITCERRLPAVPMLLHIINLTALAKGLIALHASAFVHEGRGVLVAGWAKGGKTELLLAFMERGASYVGDEWIYVTPERVMLGIPEPMRLWRWQLAQLPDFAARLRRGEKLKLAALDALARTVEGVAPSRGSSLPASVLRRAAPVIRRQVNVQMPPVRLFGAESMVSAANLDHLFLVSSHASPELYAEDMWADEVAARMLASNTEERQPLMSLYRQFRFAFPQLSNPFLEEVGQTEAKVMQSALTGVPASWLRHPYPVQLTSLREAAERALG